MSADLRIEIDCDNSELTPLLAELSESPKEVVDGLPGLQNALSDLVRVESEDFIASGATHLVIHLKPSERLIGLVAALRARNTDLHAGEKI